MTVLVRLEVTRGRLPRMNLRIDKPGGMLTTLDSIDQWLVSGLDQSKGENAEKEANYTEQDGLDQEAGMFSIINHDICCDCHGYNRSKNSVCCITSIS